MNDDPCPGYGKCHGAQQWCDHCGDVSDMCDCEVCYPHGRPKPPPSLMDLEFDFTQEEES